MSATLVTAYVPIPNHPRPKRVYAELMEKITTLPIPTVPILSDLEDCWLQRYLDNSGRKVEHSVGDNPKKNSLSYHIVQAQKAEWLGLAADMDNEYDPLVWIDCGIFHLPDITAEIIIDFMQRVEGEKSIVIPGCWGKDFTYSDDYPIWRFCGGLIVVPRRYAWEFCGAVKAEYFKWIEQHNRITWDVNTLARLEQRRTGLPLWWFQADHNATMFTNYVPTGRAIN